jgi:hypothetical protein
MSLKDMFDNAPVNSYVGKVRDTQYSAAKTPTGVNFMDGTRRSANNNTADEFQTEFKRNEPNAYVNGGGQAPAGLGEGTTIETVNTNSLTRWRPRAFKLAFDANNDQGPASLSKGFYHTPKYRPSFNGTQVHLYTPLANGRFVDKNTWARTRKDAGPTST